MKRKSKHNFREINAGLFFNRHRIPPLQAGQLKYKRNIYFLRLYLAEKLKTCRDRSRGTVQTVMRVDMQCPVFRLIGLALWIFAATTNMLVLANTADLNERPLATVSPGSVNAGEKSAPAPKFPLKLSFDKYFKIPPVPEQPPSFDKPEIQHYFQIIDRASTLYMVDPDLILAMVMVESRYKASAGSRKKAKGLMQLMPRTAEELGVLDIFNPEQNVLGGVKYFRQLLNKFEGDVELALAAYNAGFRKVHIYKGVPPYKETRDYIDNVFKYYTYFKIKKFLEEEKKI